MADSDDSGKFGIHGSQTKGFDRLNAKAPFGGYEKARAYFENCLPKALAPELLDEMRNVLGISTVSPPAAYASNVAFMQAISRGLQGLFAEEWKLNAERELILLTITPAQWMVDELSPVVDLRLWRGQAHRWLRRLNLTGIAFIEAAPFINYPWESRGRAISFHLHAICYRTDPTNYDDIEATLRAQLDTTMLIPFPSIDTRQIRQNESHVSFTAGYISKPGDSAKHITIKPDEKPRLRNVKLPKPLGLRQAEIMSFLKPQELILACGNAAKEWRRAILETVGVVGTQRFPDRLCDRALEGLWRQTKEALQKERSSRKWQELVACHAPVVIRR